MNREVLLGIYISIIVVCLCFSACFSAADMAYSKVSQARLSKMSDDGDKKARKALSLARDYDKTIATILFGNDFVNIMASSFFTLVSSVWLNQYLGKYAAIWSSLIFLVILLAFGEILPKNIAKGHTLFLSRFFTGLISVVGTIFLPFIWPISKLSKLISKPLLEKTGPESHVTSDEELEAMVNEIQREGLIDQDQSDLLHRSIDFRETACYEIVTPRVRISGYDIETPFTSFIKKKDAYDYSRIIVYRHDMDEIIGYLQAKTLLRELVRGNPIDLNAMIIPLESVPRTMSISDAMELMKESHHHILLVRDEYGGTEGIITLEDILEELVGEMRDEGDEDETASIQKLPQRNTYLVKGDTNIDDFYNFFGLDPDKLLEDDVSTVSGWIVDHLGRFANKGDSLEVGPLHVKVTEVDQYTVLEAQIRARRKKKRG